MPIIIDINEINVKIYKVFNKTVRLYHPVYK